MPEVERTGHLAKPAGKEKVMDSREGSVRQVGGDDAITTRWGLRRCP
jgi:hypothetical protein